MLNFYINCGGVNLSTRCKNVLERAKDALRKASSAAERARWRAATPITRRL
jgi:hypothetical protein